MKSKQKQTPTEIIDNQRQAVVEKIIEDMKRDGLRWAEPYLPSLTPHNPVSGTVYQAECLARRLDAYPQLHGTQRIRPHPVFRL